MDGNSGYLSHSILPLYFGLDQAEKVDKIEVKWPSGELQTLSGPIASNRQLEVTEPKPGAKRSTSATTNKPQAARKAPRRAARP
jgi:hypothetical protein